MSKHDGIDVSSRSSCQQTERDLAPTFASAAGRDERSILAGAVTMFASRSARVAAILVTVLGVAIGVMAAWVTSGATPVVNAPPAAPAAESPPPSRPIPATVAPASIPSGLPVLKVGASSVQVVTLHYLLRHH